MLGVVMAPVSAGALVAAPIGGLACSHMPLAACFGMPNSTSTALPKSFACPLSLSSPQRKQFTEWLTRSLFREECNSRSRFLAESADEHLLLKHRRSLYLTRSSGRFSASVIRGITGTQRIRRKKGADESEDDENSDNEPCSSFEDAPIYGSLHGNSFDEDDGADSAQTINIQSHALFGGPISEEDLAENGVPGKSGGTTEKKHKPIQHEDKPNQEKDKQEVRSAISASLGGQDQLESSKKRNKERKGEVAESLQESRNKSTKKGKKRGEGAALDAAPSGQEKKSARKAERKLRRSKAFNGRSEKDTLKTNSRAPDGARSSGAPSQVQGTELRRSKGLNLGAKEPAVVADSRTSNGAQTFKIKEPVVVVHSRSQNGAQTPQIEEPAVVVYSGSQIGGHTSSIEAQAESGSVLAREECLQDLHSSSSQVGAQARSEAGVEQDKEKESLQDRLHSSFHAGSSNSEGLRDAIHSLHFSLHASSSRSAFIVSAAAVKNVHAMAEPEASENGILSGASILTAASSLVESLVAPAQVMQAGEEVTEQIASAVGDVKDAVVGSVSAAVEAVGSGVEEATGVVTDTVSQLGEQVMETVADTVDAASDTVSNLVETVTDTVASSVADTVDSLAESLSDVGDAIVSIITEEEELGDTEFETFSSHLMGPEFRGRRGLENYRVLHDEESSFHLLYDAYNFSLKLPPHQFALVVLALPLLMSVAFTCIYLLDMHGLVPEESVQAVLVQLQKDGHVWGARAYGLFQVFMFSLSLATGLQPVLAPVTPFSFVAANMNALLAQLLFVFLSGSVFARLSQRSRPIRCSTVALVCPPCHTNRVGKERTNRVLMARYVLAGPKPSELVDVKVDLTFTYNTITRSGSYFMRQVSLKLVKSEVAHQVGGMLVRHVIDESSPLFRRTEEMLRKEDAVFKLSVVGLERSSMQSVFELQHYCVADGDVIWNAEFEDTVYVNKSMQRVIDHSKLSRWKAVLVAELPTINA